MGARVSGCKDDQADAITDPERDAGRCIGQDEIFDQLKVSSAREDAYSPDIYYRCKGGLRS